MVRRTSFFTFIILMCISCGKQKVEVKYETGTIKEQYETDRSGQKDGLFIAYDTSGNIFEESIYKQGKLVGQRKIFYPNGQIEVLENYDSMGNMEGIYQIFYPDGTIKLEKHFQNNTLVGTIKVYHSNGNLKEEVTIENNTENGPFKEYHFNGKIHWQGTYLNGDNEFGLLEEYDSTGMLIKKMMCDSNAVCITIWKPGMEEINQ